VIRARRLRRLALPDLLAVEAAGQGPMAVGPLSSRSLVNLDGKTILSVPMIEAALLCLVVGISDGDTIKVRCPNRPQIAVRLAEIDAPEKAQPFGQRSKQLLSKLCLRKQAEIRPSGRDRYGRTVARVICAGADANAAMVRAGMAWAYAMHLTDPQIQAMEGSARRERLGLWVDVDPVPPWEWRRVRERGFIAHVPAL
jgi:micrococcal nuclease